jgi:hypothetical protein
VALRPIGTNGAMLGPGFEEQVQDTDQDGLIDELDATTTVDLALSGEYLANATLTDRTGQVVATNGQGEMSLASGSQPLILKFDGSLIYRSGLWGPYTLHVMIVRLGVPTTTLVDDAVLGATAVYDPMQFQHERVSFDPRSLAFKAVDADGDGLYEELDFTGTVIVENPGLYVINTMIYAQEPWTWIAMASEEVQLRSGSNTFRLVFKGSDISKSGRDGPYVEAGLLCYLKAGSGDDSPSPPPNLTTAPYKASQFAR